MLNNLAKGLTHCIGVVQFFDNNLFVIGRCHIVVNNLLLKLVRKDN